MCSAGPAARIRRRTRGRAPDQGRARNLAPCRCLDRDQGRRSKCCDGGKRPLIKTNNREVAALRSPMPGLTKVTFHVMILLFSCCIAFSFRKPCVIFKGTFK